MTELFVTASIWMLLAMIATIIAVRLKITVPIVEITVGVIAGLISTTWLKNSFFITTPNWIEFIANAGAILLVFLAGTELEHDVLKKHWKEAGTVGVASFLVPFLGCSALAHFVLDWGPQESWLAGLALSTTSVSVVYMVMLQFGLNKTEYGKTLLSTCFVTDISTVLALGFMFSPFTWKIAVFFGTMLVAFPFLSKLDSVTLKIFNSPTAEYQTKFILLVLFSFAGLASWAGSEAVLPAYIIGIALAQNMGRDLVKHLRALTFGLLTPFYFIKAGTLVSVPTLIAAPLFVLIFLGGKIAMKSLGVYPLTRWFGASKKEGIYTSLLMSTGLAFGSITAIFGLTHNIINETQYSCLVAVVILSAIIPSIIANRYFLPTTLIKKAKVQGNRTNG